MVLVYYFRKIWRFPQSITFCFLPRWCMVIDVHIQNVKQVQDPKPFRKTLHNSCTGEGNVLHCLPPPYKITAKTSLWETSVSCWIDVAAPESRARTFLPPCAPTEARRWICLGYSAGKSCRKFGGKFTEFCWISLTHRINKGSILSFQEHFGEFIEKTIVTRKHLSCQLRSADVAPHNFFPELHIDSVILRETTLLRTSPFVSKDVWKRVGGLLERGCASCQELDFKLGGP